jgi:CRISPR/Cas system-associated protein Cas5 (RAMP superfamily)
VKTQAEEVVVHSAEKSSLNSMRDVEIEISNGNGVNRMARRVGDYLKGKGLKVVRLTNADNFNYSGTRIYYHKGYNEQADYIAGRLPVLQNKEEIKKFERAGIKIKVLIGKDLVSQDEVFDNKYRRLAKKEG